ncbi:MULTISPECIES: hypothetical protein [unclassified Novosphingobium]|uniref:hypothetical protein n=1 Tax=unclassified Novosphingobium TaxID=2644732 RepID=UPI00146B9E05|nr:MULTISPECIES: hypothetical protein [unclassified Novosphingobium]NMN07557.1 hypothetical protein [Novosphingobium sp. SG919]NMN89840.1 hypothetical protein [Novosphingobium sp. SG916]
MQARRRLEDQEIIVKNCRIGVSRKGWSAQELARRAKVPVNVARTALGECEGLLRLNEVIAIAVAMNFEPELLFRRGGVKAALPVETVATGHRLPHASLSTVIGASVLNCSISTGI